VKRISASRGGLGELLRNRDCLTYETIVDVWRRGLRNGGWALLDVSDKALLRCAMWVAKARGSIYNMRLLVQVLKVLLKLLQRCRSRIANAGRARARGMLESYEKDPKGVFNWAPRLRDWLCDPRYQLYLGLLAVNG